MILVDLDEFRGVYNEGEAMEARRNELDLTLDSFYSCNLGCFAA